MFKIHVVKVAPVEGRALADISLKFETPMETEVNSTAESVGIGEITEAIIELVRIRHLLHAMAKDHIGKCDECLLNAVGKDPEK